MSTGPDESQQPRSLSLVCAALWFHWLAIVIALSANLAPSMLQGKLIALLSPYLFGTHQSYGAIPLELTHGQPIDFTLFVTVQGQDGAWHAVDLGQQNHADGSIGWQRSRWAALSRNFRTVAQLAPDAEVLAEIALGVVRYQEAQTRRQVAAIRLSQLPTPSYDEYAAVADAGPTALAEIIDPVVVYEAVVIRDDHGGITGLLPREDAARTATPPIHESGGPS
ncbi:MAG: hypothetical protein KatS3mg111_3945 [Pirellulaceae bacterium]|nr:MAG: hypothetical protein KatS3mg111_3945 [Pirellulaceae bacterium]